MSTDSIETPPALDDTIVVELPPSARWIRLARLLVTSIANDAGLGRDAVEDARMAIDEACGVLVEAGVDSPLRLLFVPGPGLLSVDIGAELTMDVSPPSGLAVEVLEATTSTWSWTVEGSRAAIRLEIR